MKSISETLRDCIPENATAHSSSQNINSRKQQKGNAKGT